MYYIWKRKKKGGEIGFLCKKNWACLHLCKFLFFTYKVAYLIFLIPCSYLRRHGHYDFCFYIYIFIYYLCLKVLNLFLKILYGSLVRIHNWLYVYWLNILIIFCDPLYIMFPFINLLICGHLSLHSALQGSALERHWFDTSFNIFMIAFLVSYRY